jgi:hypothetical protein
MVRILLSTVLRITQPLWARGFWAGFRATASLVTHLSDAQMGVFFDVPETVREHKLYSRYLS